MAPTGSLVPARIDMYGVNGGDFAATIELFTDVAQTSPFDLTGFTTTVVIGNGLLTLTVGAGLTITTPANGFISVALTAAQTGALPANQHYYLKLVDGGGLVSFPVDGTLYLPYP